MTGGIKVITNDLPGSGSLLLMILNIFDKMKFTPKDIEDYNSTIKTYHRMIETYKYAFSVRTEFGDINLTKVNENKILLLLFTLI